MYQIASSCSKISHFRYEQNGVDFFRVCFCVCVHATTIISECQLYILHFFHICSIEFSGCPEKWETESETNSREIHEREEKNWIDSTIQGLNAHTMPISIQISPTKYGHWHITLHTKMITALVLTPPFLLSLGRVCRWFSCQYNHISSISHKKHDSNSWQEPATRFFPIVCLVFSFVVCFRSFVLCAIVEWVTFDWTNNLLSSTNIPVIDSVTIMFLQFFWNKTWSVLILYLFVVGTLC